MLSEARPKKIMEKLNRAQKCPILGPQNLGSGGWGGPGKCMNVSLLKNGLNAFLWYCSHLKLSFKKSKVPLTNKVQKR